MGAAQRGLLPEVVALDVVTVVVAAGLDVTLCVIPVVGAAGPHVPLGVVPVVAPAPQVPFSVVDLGLVAGPAVVDMALDVVGIGAAGRRVLLGHAFFLPYGQGYGNTWL
jgi:hypothetical protein